MSIRFYSTKDAYGEFSNFASFPFDLDGMRWPTTEHYFQAQKFHDQAYRERIRLVASPMVAARLGRSRSVPIRDDWETAKDDVMRTAIRAKFCSHPELKRLLLATGNEELIEQTTQDHYWGCGTSGTGRNMLGVLLMELRQELNATPRDQGG
jgi:ribA/ribD-fused uncharacterized protein